MANDLRHGLLGAYVHELNSVFIDESLCPETARKQLARFRFTVADEVGHVFLHGHIFAESPELSPIFLQRGLSADTSYGADSSDPRVLRLEIHANGFAACLLMPRKQVQLLWGWLNQGLPRLSERDLDSGCLRTKCPWDVKLAREF